MDENTTHQINQGDIFWLTVDDPRSSETPIRHPHVVVQEDVFNHSRVTSVIVCALTSNLQRASLPGNVLLDDGEANLSRQSVVEVAKVSSVEKSELGDYIGTLSPARIMQILDGLRFLQTSYFRR
ncbi:MAG: type II toxin-antitoxin system PemK/MazF family toxin [Aggregatilineales bacterium]